MFKIREGDMVSWKPYQGEKEYGIVLELITSVYDNNFAKIVTPKNRILTLLLQSIKLESSTCKEIH